MSKMDAIIPPTDEDTLAELEALVAGALDLYGARTSPLRVRMFALALAPYADMAEDAVLLWCRTEKTAPVPVDIIGLMPTSEYRTLRAIFTNVASAHGLSLRDVIGPGRNGKVSRCRQEGMYAARQCGHTLSRISDFLNRDHTTIIHGIHAHTERAGL